MTTEFSWGERSSVTVRRYAESCRPHLWQWVEMTTCCMWKEISAVQKSEADGGGSWVQFRSGCVTKILQQGQTQPNNQENARIRDLNLALQTLRSYSLNENQNVRLLICFFWKIVDKFLLSQDLCSVGHWVKRQGCVHRPKISALQGCVHKPCLW